MSTWAPATLFALFAWWFGTGAVLLMDRLSPRGLKAGLAAAAALVGLSVYGLFATAQDPSTVGAYLAFTCALVVWGGHELAFLNGWVTGPRRGTCPPGAKGWKRFWYATEVVLHHELALLATVGIVAYLTWGGVNQVGTWTFVVLWVMRISAKLNIYLGVRNLTEEFIPAHLAYMKSYFRKAHYNPLMPISLIGAIGVVVLLARATAGAPAPEAAGAALVGTMLGLAALEHAFLMLPVPDALLWKWATRSRTSPALAPSVEPVRR